MRAVRIEGPALRWDEAEDPVVGPGEIGIRVAATAVNRADLLQRTGLYPPPAGASPILGLECAGVVDEVGPGVARWRAGDPVCALLSGGGYAERVAVPAGQALPIPAGMDAVGAAALPEVLATAWMVLRDEARLQPGEKVLVHAGASGVGTAIVQVCRAWGNPVFVTAGSAEKVAACEALGAQDGAVRSAWEEAAARWGPIDVIVDPVGGGYLPRDQRVLAVGGRVVLIGLMGGTSAPLDLGRLLVKRQRVIGTVLRARVPEDKARVVAGVERDLWPLVADGRVRPVIDVVLPIAEIEAAHARVASNVTVGKVVLRVG